LLTLPPPLILAAALFYSSKPQNQVEPRRDRTLAKTIGIIGGTGPEGKGLAARFAKAGLEVILGSRTAEKGIEAAKEVATASGGKVKGGPNADAAAAEIVILTIPYEGLRETLQPLEAQIGERVVISTIVPMRFKEGRPSMMATQTGSAAEDVQILLPQAQVVGAFQTSAARKLADLGIQLEGDVIVCSDHPSAAREVIELAELIGLRGVNAGPLSNSRYVEGITALLVSVNRIHRKETGIKVVGL
jgi:NADPH-dependent F420 reductase